MRGLFLLIQTQSLHGCDSPNPTVRAAVIVAPQPLRGQGLCFGQAVEYVPIKAFFTHGAVEALHIWAPLKILPSLPKVAKASKAPKKAA